ncbi:MAG: hypothetical protein Fur003_3540 [Candidatus Dojkabacteria bacterium]
MQKTQSIKPITQGSNPDGVNNYNQQTKFMKIGAALFVAAMLFSFGIMTGRATEGGRLDWSSFFSPRNNETIQITGNTSGKDVTTLDFDLYWEIWQTISDRFVDEKAIKQDEMFYESIKGMVDSLGDPHTLFLSPEETKAFNDSNAGNFFSGIGAELGYEDGRVIVVTPLKGSPAIEAGIKPGDLILKIDDTTLDSKTTVFDAVAKIRGKKGTEVTLTVVHPGDQKATEIKIVRDDITVPSMEFSYDKSNKVATIEVSRFSEASLNAWEEKWDTMVDQVEKSGAKGVIIDLRGNPGGFLDAAVYAASEFLPKGKVVVEQEDRQGHIKDYKVDREGRLTEIPVVILVNNSSASASEILAGALQKNNNRAYVIGMETYGKGTAQEVIDFPDGSSLHLTVIKWLLPDGTWLNKENKIVPDKKVDLTDDDFKAGRDPQREEAIKKLKK